MDGEGEDAQPIITYLEGDGWRLYKQKYNGKEWQDELGLNMTAMDFRQYDNAIGRFNCIDVLAEMTSQVTPYNFTGGNPEIYADPSGLRWIKMFSGLNSGSTMLDVLWNTTPHGQNSQTFTNMGNGDFTDSEGNVIESNGNVTDIWQYVSNIQHVQGNGEPPKTFIEWLRSIFRFAQTEEGVKQSNFDREVFYVTSKSFIEAGGLGLNLFSIIVTLPVTELRGGQYILQFGKNSNQVYHTFRHIEAMGLTQKQVINAIKKNFPTIASQLEPGKPLNTIITVGGQQIQYTAYLIEDGLINIGRIHGI